ncbi:HAD family hydrolase [Taibaiella koreensis]|uniref:HAD family hydrolase n=1 Tax=Taibaiella koreensis TaxID=1268548 RepID=UPI0013C2B967|nr:HAD hydrolase-like protein [Taibaiella koreensis]
MKQYLIVFDIDGTLTDSVAPHQTAFVTALQQMGITEIDTNFKNYRHHTDKHIARSFMKRTRQRPLIRNNRNGLKPCCIRPYVLSRSQRSPARWR